MVPYLELAEATGMEVWQGPLEVWQGPMLLRLCGSRSSGGLPELCLVHFPCIFPQLYRFHSQGPKP